MSARSRSRAETVRMRAMVLILLPVLAAAATMAAASHDIGVGGFAVQRELADPEQQLPEVATVNVTMRCVSGDAGHRITITASSREEKRHVCQSRCYYRTNSGQTGLFYGSAIIPPASDNVQLRTDYFPDFVVSVTHAGSFSCQ